MSKSTGSYPSLIVDTTAQRVVSHAGAVLLAATASRIGLDRELSAALRPWMRPLAVHDPGKVLLDLAIAVAIGGDCLADIAQLRAEPGVFGQVASDPTVSRLIDTLAADAPAALAAINTARAAVRARVWELAGTDAPDHEATAKRPADHRSGRHLDHRALGEGAGSSDFQAGLRSPPDRRRGSTTAPAAPVNPSRCSSEKATPGQTPPPITSRSPRPRCGSCRPPTRVGDPGRRC